MTSEQIEEVGGVVFKILQLTNVEEFEEVHGGKLFQESPEHWSSLENAICDYQARVWLEIVKLLKELNQKS
mgnify:CR=1 FL=1